MCSRLQPYVLEAATLCAHPVFNPVQALLGGLAGIPSLPPRLAEQPLFAAQACVHMYILLAAQACIHGLYHTFCPTHSTRPARSLYTCNMYVHAHAGHPDARVRH